MSDLLRVTDLVKHFPVRTGGILRRPTAAVHALDGVSFSVAPGETLGIVGESGCGKTTLARTIVRLARPDAGRIEFAGQDISHLSGPGLRQVRRELQMVFQDPFESLNPRMTVRDIVAEPLVAHGLWRDGGRRKVAELLERVGLEPAHAQRYPHEFSGGQRQRIGIARALALHPRLIVCDEPVSALDVSMRAQVLNLLTELQADMGLTYVFISHDLSVIRAVCDRVAVMYLGQLVEVATRDDLFSASLHPYTQALLSAVPIPDPDIEVTRRRIVLAGEVPNPIDPPSGCRFHTRCWKAEPRCSTVEPILLAQVEHAASCHFPAPIAPAVVGPTA